MLAGFLSSPPDSCGRSKSLANLPNNFHRNVTDRAVGHVRAAAESPAGRPASTGSVSRSSALTPAARRGEQKRSRTVHGRALSVTTTERMNQDTSARVRSRPKRARLHLARPVVRRVIATVNRLQRLTLTVTRTKRPRFAKRPKQKWPDPVRNQCSARAQGPSTSLHRSKRGLCLDGS